MCLVFAKASRPATMLIASTSGLVALASGRNWRSNRLILWNHAMFEDSPNGCFVRDLLVFNGLRQGGYVAKGFIFQPPDLNNAQISELNDFQDQISLLLASLHGGQRLQIQYFCDSDYRAELMRYQAETDKMDNVWTQRSRNERFSRYWKQMTQRKLRRQKLILYISRRIETSPKGVLSEK